MIAGDHLTRVRLSELTDRFFADFLKSLYLSSHKREMAWWGEREHMENGQTQARRTKTADTKQMFSIIYTPRLHNLRGSQLNSPHHLCPPNSSSHPPTPRTVFCTPGMQHNQPSEAVVSGPEQKEKMLHFTMAEGPPGS